MNALDAPLFSHDFETDLMAPGYRIPTPAIATTWSEATGARLWITRELEGLCEWMLTEAVAGRVYIVGANWAGFDAPVIAERMPWLRPLLWQAFELNRVLDTQIAERIIQIHRGYRGELALDGLARKYGVAMKAKDDPETRAIRLSFGQFIGAEQIPDAHARYALDDAIVAPTVWQRQFETGLVDIRDVGELARQTFALALVSARGFRTDHEHVQKLDAMVTERIAELEAIARECGFLRTSNKGEVSRNMAAIHEAIARDYAPEIWGELDQWRADAHAWWLARRGATTRKLPQAWQVRAEKEYAAEIIWRDVEDPQTGLRTRTGGPRGEPDPWSDPRIPKTDAGNVRADRLTLEDATDQRLQALSEWGQLLAVRNKDLKVFYEGVVQPISTRFGIADTLRPTSSDPNCLNWGKLKGVRECIAAREGYALGVSDFKMLELVALAQLIYERLGLTTMRDKINQGIDMHAEIGADVLECSYEEIQRRRKAGDHDADEARDCGKPANFGLNGGMQSAETFMLYARKSYGQDLVKRLPGESVQDWNARRLAKAERVMQAWRERAVDQQAYLQAIRNTRNELRLYDMPHPDMHNLWRHALRFTEAANNPFQIKGRNVGARALWLVIKAQYCTGEMAGSHVVFYVYDDISSEIPLDKLHHVEIQERLMCQASLEICPDVFAGVDTRVLSHLSKSAKASKDAATGQLTVTQVSMPDHIGGKH